MYLILKSSFHYVITFNVMLLFSYMSQEIITLKGISCSYISMLYLSKSIFPNPLWRDPKTYLPILLWWLCGHMSRIFYHFISRFVLCYYCNRNTYWHFFQMGVMWIAVSNPKSRIAISFCKVIFLWTPLNTT